MLRPLPAEAEQLVIRRVTPKTQTVDLNDNMRLRAAIIEAVGDKATMAIQEISQQNISRDDTEEIKAELQSAIAAEAQTRANADSALQSAITAEAQTRANADSALQAAITAEAQTRANADNDLQTQANELKVMSDKNRYDLNYLLQFIMAKLGPLIPDKIITEAGAFWVTESGYQLVAAGTLAPDKITTETGDFWVTEPGYRFVV